MTNDTPVTDKELASYYGSAPTAQEVAICIGSAAANFDADSLSEAVNSKAEAIEEALARGDYELAGLIIDLARKQHIAAEASLSIYGRKNLIIAGEVRV